MKTNDSDEQQLIFHNIKDGRLIKSTRLKSNIWNIHWNIELDTIFLFDEKSQLKEFNQMKNLNNPNFDMKIKLNIHVACINCFDCHSRNSGL